MKIDKEGKKNLLSLVCWLKLIIYNIVIAMKNFNEDIKIVMFISKENLYILLLFLILCG